MGCGFNEQDTTQPAIIAHRGNNVSPNTEYTHQAKYRTSAQATEVFSCAWRNIALELHHDPTSSGP